MIEVSDQTTAWIQGFTDTSLRWILNRVQDDVKKGVRPLGAGRLNFRMTFK